MHISTALSTRLAKAQNAYRVGLLITIEGEPAVARNVKVALQPTHPAVSAVMVYQRFPMESSELGEYVICLGDLSATDSQPLGVSLFVEHLGSPGVVHVANVRVSADVAVGEGVEHQAISEQIVANLDGTDHLARTVERTIARFQAARARQDAIQQADAGNFDGAANTLRVARDSLASYARPAEIAEEIADLAAESMRLARRERPDTPRAD